MEAASGVTGDPQTFEALPGMGIRAIVDGKSVLLGKPQLILDQKLEIPLGVREQIFELTSGGYKTIIIAINETVAGLLVFEDQVRPETQALMRQVRSMGLRTVLLIGDQSRTAQRAVRLR